MKQLLKKIWNWIDDNIIWYLWDVPIDWYKSIRHWFKICGGNKIYWKNLKKYAFDHYPWDEGYFYESQYMWLTYAIDYFENKCSHLTKNSIDSKLRTMKLAKRMLDIYMEKEDLFVYEDTQCKTENWWERYKHVCLKRVNLRNKDRFKYLVVNWDNNLVGCSSEIYEQFPEELYKAKALHLYTLILKRYSQTWWD